MGNLLASAVVRFLEMLVNGLTGEIGKYMADVLGVRPVSWTGRYVRNAVGVAQAVAGVLLGLKVEVETLRVWILQTSGDPGADPGGRGRPAKGQGAGGEPGSGRAARQPMRRPGDH